MTRALPPLVFVGLLGAAVLTVVLTGRGSPGVSAPLWGAVVMVASACIGWHSASGRLGPVLGAAGIGFGASAVLATPGFPLAHDLSLHVWVMESFARAVAAGDLWPRWHASIGLGTPLGLFYPPLPFWTAVPFHALGFTPSEMARGSLWLLHVLAAASMAGAALHAGRSRIVALAAGGTYALAPYLVFDLHGRGALGEATALVFLPWLLAGADRVLRGERGFFALVFGGVGIVYSHALSLVLLAAALPLAGVATLATLAGEVRGGAWTGFAQCFVAALLVATLGAWQLLPAVFESEYTALRAVTAGPFAPPYAEFAPAALDLVEHRAVDVFVISNPGSKRVPGNLEEMPYYVGVGLLLLAAYGAQGCRRRAGDLFAAWLCVAGIALSLEPLASVWGSTELLSRIQFPWRHLLLTTLGAAWLAGRAFERIATPNGRRGSALAVVAGLVLVIDAYAYLGLPVLAVEREEIVYAADATDRNGVFQPLAWDDVPLRCEALLIPPTDRRLSVWRASPSYPEYLTPDLFVSYLLATRRGDASASREAGVRCRSLADGVALQPAAALVERLGSLEGATLPLRFRFEDGGDTTVWHFEMPVAGRIRLRVQYFPGFTAHDDAGRALALQDCGGWICIDAPEATGRITLHFGSTPVRSTGLAITGASVLVLLGVLYTSKRRSSTR